MEEQAGHSNHKRSGFCAGTGIYHTLQRLDNHQQIPTSPDLDTATFVLSQFPHSDQFNTQVVLIDLTTNRRLAYAELRRSINALATGLRHALGICKGDVVFVLSPNSILYPTICLAVLSIGAILTTANPLNTASEIAKQVRDSGTKLAICAPEQLHKLPPTGLPTLVTRRVKGKGKGNGNDSSLSVEELVEECEPSDEASAKPTQSDTAVLLYSSGTTGASKCVILTHGNLISVITLFKWTIDATNAHEDVFLSFIPMFHVYGLVFFILGIFYVGATMVVMPRFDFQAMLEAIQVHRVTQIPAVPPVILALVKHTLTDSYDLSSLSRVGSGAAPLSQEVANAFHAKFPWVQLRPGYGLTETTGAATFSVSAAQAKAHPGSVGQLLPCFYAKVMDVETGRPLPPYKHGELWLKSPTVMKGYLGNEEATAVAIDPHGWLRTGDLCHFDEDGFLYIVDRIKELIKHNGYQVAPAELEAILLSHPQILDAAVIPGEDEEAGQVPIAYAVRKPQSKLTEQQVIQFISSQVASYKRIKKVSFINVIPRSAAGKILRKELVAQYQQAISRL